MKTKIEKNLIQNIMDIEKAIDVAYKNATFELTNLIKARTDKTPTKNRLKKIVSSPRGFYVTLDGADCNPFKQCIETIRLCDSLATIAFGNYSVKL